MCRRPTYRVLSHIGSVLRNLVVDDLLGCSVGRGCIGHQLRVTGAVQAGEKESCFVDGAADRQEAIDQVSENPLAQICPLTRDSVECSQYCLHQEPAQSAGPPPAPAQRRRGCRRRPVSRRSCTRLPAVSIQCPEKDNCEIP